MNQQPDGALQADGFQPTPDTLDSFKTANDSVQEQQKIDETNCKETTDFQQSRASGLRYMDSVRDVSYAIGGVLDTPRNYRRSLKNAITHKPSSKKSKKDHKRSKTSSGKGHRHASLSPSDMGVASVLPLEETSVRCGLDSEYLEQIPRLQDLPSLFNAFDCQSDMLFKTNKDNPELDELVELEYEKVLSQAKFQTAKASEEPNQESGLNPPQNVAMEADGNNNNNNNNEAPHHYVNIDSNILAKAGSEVSLSDDPQPLTTKIVNDRDHLKKVKLEANIPQDEQEKQYYHYQSKEDPGVPEPVLLSQTAAPFQNTLKLASESKNQIPKTTLKNTDTEKAYHSSSKTDLNPTSMFIGKAYQSKEILKKEKDETGKDVALTSSDKPERQKSKISTGSDTSKKKSKKGSLKTLPESQALSESLVVSGVKKGPEGQKGYLVHQKDIYEVKSGTTIELPLEKGRLQAYAKLIFEIEDDDSFQQNVSQNNE